MKNRVDKNGIKVIPMPPRTKGVIRTRDKSCYKVKYYSQERAEEMAASAYDFGGSYVAYMCPTTGKAHWHIGHKRD